MAKRVRIKHKRQGVPFKSKKLRVLFLGPGQLVISALAGMMDKYDGVKARWLPVVAGPSDINDGVISGKGYNQKDEFIVVVDSVTPKAFKVISAIEQKYTLAKIIYLASAIETKPAQRVMMSGAVGIVLKSQLPDELRAALTAVAAGRFYLDGMTGNVLDSIQRFNANPFKGKKLSAAETQVVRCIGDGYAVPEIMREMGKSANGVKCARTSALKKLGLINTADLVKYAIRAGLCSLD